MKSLSKDLEYAVSEMNNMDRTVSGVAAHESLENAFANSEESLLIKLYEELGWESLFLRHSGRIFYTYEFKPITPLRYVSFTVTI